MSILTQEFPLLPPAKCSCTNCGSEQLFRQMVPLFHRTETGLEITVNHSFSCS